MRRLLIILFALFVSLTSSANAKTSLKNVYQYCSDWRENNFELKDGIKVGVGYCLGVLSAWQSVAQLNCYIRSEIKADNTPAVFQGAFEGYDSKQLVFAVINYAERNPASWDTDFILLGAAIAASSNLKCKED